MVGGGGSNGWENDPYEISGGDGRASVEGFKLFQQVLASVLEHRESAQDGAEEDEIDAAVQVGFSRTQFPEIASSLEIVLQSVGGRTGGLKEVVERTEVTPDEKTEFFRHQAEWRGVFEQMRVSHTVGIWAVFALETEAKAEAFRIFSAAISSAMRELVDGAVDEVEQAQSHLDDSPPEKYTVDVHAWSNAVEARQHTLRAALAARYGGLSTAPTASMVAGAPVVIIVKESAPADAVRPHEPNVVDEEDEAIHSWQAACLGLCIVRIVEVPAVDQLNVVVASVLRQDVDSALAPVLVVLRLPIDSAVAHGIEALWQTCDTYNVRLHAEGPSLALLAQSDPPMSARLCWHFANTMLLEPAAWFSLPSSCVVTYCKDDSTEDEDSTWANGHFAKDDANAMLQHAVAIADHSLPSLTAMWMFLKRSGTVFLRVLIESATKRSSLLLEQLANVPNIEALAVGAGGNVLMSYGMSRVDRVMRKYKAKERVSVVNRAFLRELGDIGGNLKLDTVVRDSQTWILFSPVQLLRLGRFAIPSEETIAVFTERLRDLSEQYLAVSLAGSAFAAVVRSSDSIVLLDSAAAGEEAVFSFGVIRVVPRELREEPDVRPEEIDSATISFGKDLDLFLRKGEGPLFVLSHVVYVDGLSAICIGPDELCDKRKAVEFAGVAGRVCLDVAETFAEAWTRKFEQRSPEETAAQSELPEDDEGSHESYDEVHSDINHQHSGHTDDRADDRDSREVSDGADASGAESPRESNCASPPKEHQLDRSDGVASDAELTDRSDGDQDGTPEHDRETSDDRLGDRAAETSGSDGRREDRYERDSRSDQSGDEKRDDTAASAAFGFRGVLKFFRGESSEPSTKKNQRAETRARDPLGGDPSQEDQESSNDLSASEDENDESDGPQIDARETSPRPTDLDRVNARQGDSAESGAQELAGRGLFSWFRRDPAKPRPQTVPGSSGSKKGDGPEASGSDADVEGSEDSNSVRGSDDTEVPADEASSQGVVNDDEDSEQELVDADGVQGSSRVTSAWFRRRRENPAIVERVVGRDISQVIEPDEGELSSNDHAPPDMDSSTESSGRESTGALSKPAQRSIMSWLTKAVDANRKMETSGNDMDYGGAGQSSAIADNDRDSTRSATGTTSSSG